MNSISLLDIKTDYIFKLVFGNEKNKDILISFLNAVFKGKPKVKDIQLKNTEIAKVLDSNRTVRLDVKAEIDNKCYVDIEIQVRNTGDLIDRGIQYLSSMMVENFDSKAQTQSYRFPKVIGIWILAQSITDRKAAVNEAVMTFQKNQMEDYKIASDKIRLFTIELPKFNPNKLDRKNMLDVWMTFLKDPLNDEAQQVEEVHKAFDLLKEVSADEEVREFYRLRKETEFGYISEMNIKALQAKEEGKREGKAEGLKEGRAEGLKAGKAKGKAEGLKEGRAEGLKEGEAKGKAEGLKVGEAKGIIEGRNEKAIDVAKKLLKAKVGIGIIAQSTGLSIAEIEKLTG